jgi:hypothetical protein
MRMLKSTRAPAAAPRYTHQSTSDCSTELASYLRIEERELDVGGMNGGPRLQFGRGQGSRRRTRKCPMCGSTTWVLLDGHSTLQALEGGLEALAYSCEECGFIRWHRMDKAEPRA